MPVACLQAETAGRGSTLASAAYSLLCGCWHSHEGAVRRCGVLAYAIALGDNDALQDGACAALAGEPVGDAQIELVEADHGWIMCAGVGAVDPHDGTPAHEVNVRQLHFVPIVPAILNHVACARTCLVRQGSRYCMGMPPLRMVPGQAGRSRVRVHQCVL